MKIVVTKYQWVDSVALNNCNLFQNIYAVGDLTTTELTIYDGNLATPQYLVRDSLEDVEYTFEDVDDTDNSLLFEPSEVSFKVINSNFPTATDMFSFFSMQEANPRIKWKFDLYNSEDTLIYTGIIYKDGVKCNNRRDAIIDITVLGLEKEFKLFFENITLYGFEFLPTTTLPITLAGLQFAKLSGVLQSNFYSVVFDFTSDSSHFVHEYYVNNVPYIYTPHNYMKEYSLLLLKSGYDCFVRDEIDRFTWFNSLMLSMGWRWFFKNGVLNIVKRGKRRATTLTIDYNDVRNSIIRHGISNRLQLHQADSVIINDGQWFSDTRENTSTALNITTSTSGIFFYLGGERNVVFSNSVDYSNVTRPFKRLAFNSGSSTYSRVYGDFAFTRKADDDNDSYRNSYYTNVDPGENATETVRSYRKQNTIYVNPYIPSHENSGSLQTAYARFTGFHPLTQDIYYGNGNGYYADFRLPDAAINYTGNAGNHLLRWDSANNYYENYEQYVQTQEFADNFKPFLRNQSEIIFEFEYFGVVNDPVQDIELINYPFGDYETLYFSIEKLRFNERTGKTVFQTLMYPPDE